MSIEKINQIIGNSSFFFSLLSSYPNSFYSPVPTTTFSSPLSVFPLHSSFFNKFVSDSNKNATTASRHMGMPVPDRPNALVSLED